MGSIDTKKLKTFQGSLQSGLGILMEGTKTNISIVERDQSPPETSPEEYEEALNNEIEKSIDSLNSETGVFADCTSDGIHITLGEDLLFASGKADIDPAAFPILERITAIIKKVPHSIRIEGHTDNDPIRTRRFPSNWELSTSRAIHILKFFIDMGKINPTRLSAVGYGESRPLVTNDSDEQKAKNRRVEIILKAKEET